MYRRDLLTAGGVVLVAGCLGDSGGEYHGEAADYLLTESEVGGRWTEDRTRSVSYGTSAVESGRAIVFVDDLDTLTVALAVFGTVSDAEAMLSDRRASYEETGLEVGEEDVGDAAISADDGRIATVDARRSNVFFEAYGDLELGEARRVARAQDQKLLA